MKLLRAVSTVVLALLLQAGLARIWPESHRFVDVLLVPVVVYGLFGSQRSAMLVGCAAGLLQDTWFQVGSFGVNGFKKTLSGWALGGIASRIDLNHAGGRFVVGAAFAVADNLLDLALRRLLDQQLLARGALELLVQALATGLLVALVGSMLDRTRGAQRVRRFV